MYQFYCVILFISVTLAEEPVTCQNKFEYEYKVIEKLVALGNENSALSREIKLLEAKLNGVLNTIGEQNASLNLIESHGKPGGATYVRWGKSACPVGAHKVYDGFAAGSWYNYAGNGANFLCLPRDPIWDAYDAKDGPASIHGVDYKIGGKLQDHEAPCAVCWIPRTSWLMIPGRNRCYDGWKLEYQGYLAASNQGHHRSEYICLDKSMETVEYTANRDGNGAYLYLVEARCGSLPCDTYPRGYELTCAVCSFDV